LASQAADFELAAPPVARTTMIAATTAIMATTAISSVSENAVRRCSFMSFPA
jgi:hypothetical protein